MEDSKGKRIRVVHLVNYLGPAGKEIGILKLLNHMDSSLFENHLLVFGKKDIFGEKDFDHLNIRYLNKKDGNDISLLYKLTHLFRQLKPDIVHTHSWGTLVEGILGAKISRVPIIFHGEHGTLPESVIHRCVQRFFWKNSDLVLSVSENLKEKLSRVLGFPPERIQVILNGVESDKFYPSDELREAFRKRFAFSTNDFVVGTVGRMSAVKNQQMLIKAAAELKNRGECIHFVLVGVGQEENELEKLTDVLQVRDNVRFLGYQKEVNQMLNGMDVFTLTSFSEGCSNVIQEALFAGKPVIATNVGGNPELVKPGLNGFLVESNDHTELAQKILTLKRKPDLVRKFKENALSYSHENFSLKSMVDQYSELYVKSYQEKLLGNAAPLHV